MSDIPLQPFRSALVLPWVVFAAGVALFWGNYLDDTYIHLRYAENFLQTGRMEYNPGQSSFGCSAPLYVWGMGPVLRWMPRDYWPLLPKLFSILCQAVTIAIFLDLYRRVGTQDAKGNQSAGAKWHLEAGLVTTALLCPPLVCRWLQDGMETSFATMLCALGVWALAAPGERGRLMAFVASVALLGGLRVDLLPHAGCFLLAGLVSRPGRDMFLAVSTAVLLMSVPHVINLMTFGAIMPDTALAKSVGGFDLTWLKGAATSIIAMHPLWLLLGAAPWICILMLRNSGAGREKILLAVLALPLLVVLLGGVMRNQIIQGARYFMPSLIMCGLAALTWGRGKVRGGGGTTGISAALALALTLLMTVVCWPKINGLRSGIQAEFPAELNGRSIFAADIGIIGWKTHGVILDASRLVNGRAVAALSSQEWCSQLASRGMADSLILDESDLASLAQWLPGSVYDPVSGNIQLVAPDNQKISFEPRGIVMRQQTVGALVEWSLWMKKPSAAPKP